MPYLSFRFIAYEVPTAAFKPDGSGPVCDFDPGEEADPVERLPVLGNVSGDARIRLLRLAAVIDLAAKQLGSKDASSTLKVFVAPEFYFRPAAGSDVDHETYSTRDFNALIAALDGMFTNDDFRDWLFVPGTMLWNTNLDTFRPTLFRNTLAHIWGGRQRSMHLIEKNQAAINDGVTLKYTPARDESYRLFHESWKTQRSHVAAIGGVSVGFEICRDHDVAAPNRVLKTVLSNWKSNEGGNEPALSLHVLTAGGMEIMPGSVAAKINGYILRNDGATNDGARSELRQIVAYKTSESSDSQPIEVAPSDLRGKATLGQSVPAEQTIALTGKLDMPAREDYLSFDQRIVVYPVCDLA